MKQRCETCKHPAKICINSGYYCFQHAQEIRAENICFAAAVKKWDTQRGIAFVKWKKDCEAIVLAMIANSLKYEELVDLARNSRSSYDTTMARKRPLRKVK